MTDARSIKETTDCRTVFRELLGSPVQATREYSIWSCPFHSEATVGAFHVYPDGYKCFSCGEYGDIYTVRERLLGESFQEALSHYSADEYVPLTHEQKLQIATARAEQVRADLDAKIAEANKVLDELRKVKAWEHYHENLHEQERKLWRGRGIRDDFYIDWWQLGYCPDFQVYVHETASDWHSPTLSIPIWGEQWSIHGLKHRLLTPPPDRDGYRYRPDSRGCSPAPFMANPDIDKGPLLLVEGEIKAMVAFITTDDPNLQVAGLPGVSPSVTVFTRFKEYDPVYVLLDPDGYRSYDGVGKADEKMDKGLANFANPEKSKAPIDRVIEALGASRVRVLRLPMKVDDAINAGALDKYGMRHMLRTGRSL